MIQPTKMSNPVFQYIWNRTHNYKKNYIQVITGAAGEGKSYTALKMAEELDPNFNIDKVCFTASQFLNAVDTIKRNGEVLIMDEIGVALSSRKWQSLSNVLTNEIIQTFRYKRIISFFVVPDFSFVDSQARKLVQAFSEVKRLGNDPAEMWIYFLSYDRKRGKPYFEHPLIQNNGMSMKVQRLIFKGMASKDLINQYEEKHKKFKEQLRQKNIKILDLMDRELLGQQENIYDMVEEVVNNIDEYKNARDRLDWTLIANDLSVSQIKAKQIKSLVEKRVRQL